MDYCCISCWILTFLDVLEEPRTGLPDFISRQVKSSRLFWFDEGEGDSADLRVRCGGLEYCEPDYVVDRPGFPGMILELVAGGSGTVTLDGVSCPLQAGAFFLYGPQTAHRITSNPDNPLVKYFVIFDGGGAGTFLEELGLPLGVVSRLTSSELMARSFDTLIDRGSRKTVLSQAICRVILQEILMISREDAIEAGEMETKAFTTFQRVRHHIESHCLELRSLEAIAVACGLDRAYLCRLFRRFQGESPYRFLTHLKMRHAAGLLLEEDRSVKEVAATLGFADAFHFSRVFKSVHRVPPSRFRQGATGLNVS